MKTFVAVAALAMFAALGGARPVAAQDPGPSVTVAGCGFNAWSLSPLALGGAVQLRFKASVPTDAVDFQLNWGDGEVTPLHDVGRFDPGVAIAHQLDFPMLGPVSGETLQSLTVAVTRTHTTSGILWESPLRDAPPAFRCAIYPGWF